MNDTSRPADNAVSASSSSTPPSAAMLQPEAFCHFLDQLYDGVYFVNSDRRITFWNRGAQLLSGYTQAEVLGRCCSDGVLHHVSRDGTVLCPGNCPLEASMASGAPVESVMYMQHKNGHRVQVNIRVSPLTDPSGRIAGAMQVFNETGNSRFARLRNKQLSARGFLDLLTETPNRRYMEVELFRALHDFQHHGLGFGAIMLSFDMLQDVSLRLGRGVSDGLLLSAARTLTQAIEITDILGRWSVDTFIVLSPCATRQGLSLQAEHCRALIERATVEASSGDITTISAGASLVNEGDNMELFIRRLEGLLQHSRHNSQNRVTLG